jgi:hypothetical protein
MRRSLLPILALAAILAACTQKNTADQQQGQAGSAAADVALGVNRFLLFPNPIGTDPFAQNGGTFETDTTAYAQAYYAAIDPTNAKATIDQWKTANGFTGTESTTEHLAVFRDVKDLGYGRRMTGRFNTSDGSVAFYVENYNVAPNGSSGYSSDLNVDAAIRRDTQWHVGTNAIEWSATPCLNIANGYPYNYDPPDCNGTVKFAKYYNFSSADGTRQLTVDLDGRGLKAMPGVCITCHGGRGDPLTPPDSAGNPERFPLVENSLSRKRGDAQARLHGMNVDSFSYSTTQAGFAKSDLQPKLLDFNQWIMCTYPWDSTGTTSQTLTGQNGWGSCTRTAAGANEWQGGAAEMIQKWYGGPAMTATFSDVYVPPTWQSTAAIIGPAPNNTVLNFAPVDLYNNVVAPYCRTCHILRGTKNQSDIDFMTYGVQASGVNPATGFLSFADRIKALVFDRGNMPLAQIPHQDFWNSSAPQTLATFVDAMTTQGNATSNGAPLMPGRPIADPGPDRMVRTGANAVLTGENSLFATTFNWSLDPTGPQTATITNPNGMVAIFNASVATNPVGINTPYKVVLTVNGSVSKTMNVTVDDNFPDPLNIKFAHVKNVLQNIQHSTAQASGKCVSCHTSPAVSPTPPIFYNSTLDRDNNGAVDATDEAWFLKAVQGRVNLTEIAASPLLRKPTGNHHRGLMLLDVTDTTSNGGLRNYSILYNWILAGMQSGGVAASAVVNGGALGSIASPVQLAFTGAPAYATGITLDASGSIGATTYFWSVSGSNGPTGAVPFVTNPTAPSTTLNLPYIGSYVVQLQVSDGVSTDTVQQIITVSEVPVVASFSPATGTSTVSFSNTPLRGNITLTSTSTGNPTTCRWQVSGPAGATLDGLSLLDVTKSCGTPAILSVSSGSIGGTYAVTLTATSGVGTSSTSATHNLTVASAGSGVVASAGSNSTLALQFTNPSFDGTTFNSAGIPVAPTIALDGSGSAGPGSLTYSWSLTGAPGNATGSYAPLIASPSSVSTTLTVHRAGTYTVQLFVSNGLPPGPSNTATRQIVVNVPANATFTNVAATFPARNCTQAGCHVAGSTSPPSWVSGDVVGGLTLYQRVTARVGASGLQDPATSFLITCPAEGCAMPQQTGFFDGDTSSYTLFLNWIIGGALNN